MMRTEDPTVTSPDLLNLIWTRAGSPVRPRRTTDAPAVLDKMTEAALRLRDELDAYIRRNDALAAACDETPTCPCGNPLPDVGVGRTREYCSARCRTAAARSRKRVRSQATKSPAIRGAVG